MKLSGAGNDFIVVDNRTRVMDPRKMPAFVASVCTRHLSVGADGLVFIEKSPKAHFRWRFYNNDGGEAEFCGNGARCVARFAYLVEHTSTAEVIGLGRQIRRHPAFKPAGTNVDFIEVVDRRTIRVRTYERGVEDETLACGSGAIAAALIAAVVHKVESPLTV